MKISTSPTSTPNPKLLVIVLGASMFFVGICGISYEYTFSRLASDILGNSVKQWAIIIGLMMLFMGIGADLQKYFPDHLNVDNFIFLEILLGLLGGIGPTVSLYSFSGFHDHFILIHYFFICAIGLMIGLEIPLLSRVNQETAPSLKHNLGLILKMDYIGSFVGALVWVFILPRFFNILEISYFLGLINVSIAIFTWFWLRQWMKYPGRIIIVAIITFVILLLGIFNGNKLSTTAEQKLYRDRIIYTQTTPYQRIVFTESHSGDLYLYINGHLQFSSLDEFIYHEFLVHPAMATTKIKSKVLILGGGDGLAVREVLKYKDVESITLVDLDPEMTDLATKFDKLTELNRFSLSNPKTSVKKAQGISIGKKADLNLRGQGFFRRQKQINSIQVHVMNLDAYTFAESISGIYDIIIIDFPDPNAPALSKLYSLDFYALLKNKLAFDGIIIQQSSSPTFAKEAYLVIGRSMEAAGYSTVPIHHPVPSFGDWGWWVAGHQERFGKNGLKQRLVKDIQLPDSVRYITPELIRGSLNFGLDALKSKNHDISTVLKDRVFYYYQKAWKQLQ